MVSAGMPVPETESSYSFPFEKSIIERTMQYIKDRTECFDDYFPCSRKKGCNFTISKTGSTYLQTMHNKKMINA